LTPKQHTALIVTKPGYETATQTSFAPISGAISTRNAKKHASKEKESLREYERHGSKKSHNIRGRSSINQAVSHTGLDRNESVLSAAAEQSSLMIVKMANPNDADEAAAKKNADRTYSNARASAISVNEENKTLANNRPSVRKPLHQQAISSNNTHVSQQKSQLNQLIQSEQMKPPKFVEKERSSNQTATSNKTSKKSTYRDSKHSKNDSTSDVVSAYLTKQQISQMKKAQTSLSTTANG
jgi:hypothetical protein